jgi:hypothetical protein
MKHKSKIRDMSDVTKGYEDFIKQKQSNTNNKQLFEETIKKAVKSTKERGSK